jgi:hypothetical protein
MVTRGRVARRVLRRANKISERRADSYAGSRTRPLIGPSPCSLRSLRLLRSRPLPNRERAREVRERTRQNAPPPARENAPPPARHGGGHQGAIAAPHYSAPSRLAGALLLAAALLCGCARVAQPPPVPLTVEVPVPERVPCAVAIPARPALPIASLVAGSPPADTMRAYAATVAVLKVAVGERDDLLRACIEPDSSANTPPLAGGSAAAAPAQGAHR